MSVEKLRKIYYESVRDMDAAQVQLIESGVPCTSEKLQQAQQCHRNLRLAERALTEADQATAHRSASGHIPDMIDRLMPSVIRGGRFP